MSSPYDDIIDLPHPTSKRHPRMPVRDRAAQFAPFAALTGYGERIRESERQTQKEPDLTEERATALNEQLHILEALCGQRPQVYAEVFEKDPVKPGGQIKPAEGRVRRVNLPERFLELEGGKRLRLDDIVSIRIESPE